MNQTVEFEYGINSRVRVRDDAGSFAGEKGRIIELQQCEECHAYLVAIDGLIKRERFRGEHLERDIPEPQPPTPTSPPVGLAYAPGDRVRVVNAWSPYEGQSGTVSEAMSSGGCTWVKVSFDVTQEAAPFEQDSLERILPDAAPAPTFPRVIWQSKPITPHDDDVSWREDLSFRVVQDTERSFVDEVHGRDAMGVKRWRALGPSADWHRDAIVEKLERQAEAAKLRREAEPNGSTDKGAAHGA